MAHKNWEGVTVRLTPEEAAELAELAGEAGYVTSAEYLGVIVRTFLPGTPARLEKFVRAQAARAKAKGDD